MQQQTTEEVTEQAPAAQSQSLHDGQWFPYTSLETARQLRALKDQEYVENLLNTVQAEARKLRKSRRGTRNMALCFGGVIALMVAAYCARALHTGNWDMSDWFTYIFMFGSFGGVAAASRTHKEAVSELTRIEDIRAVSPLAESLAIEDRRVRPLIHAALIRLLPRLQSSDAALLTLEGRACLNDALDEKDEMLTLAILKAYEQVGDETALPFVEKLAEDAAASQKWRKSGSPRLADAAQECLVYLRVRVEQQRASQTLLRAASRMDAAPDTLLRPARESAADPAQLLRADPAVNAER